MLPGRAWSVTAVNISVAIETGPRKELVLIGRRRAAERMKPGIRLRLVSTADRVMAALTDLGGCPRQECSMIAAVGLMTVQAILGHWRMLPQEGTAFRRVATITQLIDGVGLDELPAESAMDLMAIGAPEEPLGDGVMRFFVEL